MLKELTLLDSVLDGNLVDIGDIARMVGLNARAVPLFHARVRNCRIPSVRYQRANRCHWVATSFAIQLQNQFEPGRGLDRSRRNP